MTEWSFAEPLKHDQVAELMGVSSSTVWRLGQSGVLVSRMNPDPSGRGKVYSGQQVRELIAGRSMPTDQMLRARCRQAALRELRRRHPAEFREVFGALMAAEVRKREALPADTGNAQINPVQEA